MHLENNNILHIQHVAGIVLVVEAKCSTALAAWRMRKPRLGQAHIFRTFSDTERSTDNIQKMHFEFGDLPGDFATVGATESLP